jgi:hypothetical protein
MSLDIKILDEIKRFKIIKSIRNKLINFFINGNGKNIWGLKFTYMKKQKEIMDLISNILFFREDIDVFFPCISDENGKIKSGTKWKIAARNKMLYIKKSLMNEFDMYIKFIERTFSDEYKKIWYDKNVSQKIKLDVYHDNTDGEFLISEEISGIKIGVPFVLYKKLSGWINKKFIGKKEKIIFLTMMRYEKLLNSGNHQLAVDYGSFQMDDFYAELFASPINRSLEHFCSAYPDVDHYYRGYLGTFFEYKLENNKRYTVNPPYVELLMEDAIEYILDQLKDNSKLLGITVFISIPIWDIITIKNMYSDEDLKIRLRHSINRVYKPIQMIQKSEFHKSTTIFSHKDYSYINYAKNKKLSVADTYHIILEK